MSWRIKGRCISRKGIFVLDLLLKYKQTYWKQRCTARWAKLGEENTSYFHAMATVSFRKNAISSLVRDDGSLATTHDEKAGVLWQTYKERLGLSCNIDANFNFARYLSPHPDLSALHHEGS